MYKHVYIYTHLISSKIRMSRLLKISENSRI